MSDVVIVSGARTAVANFNGAIKDVRTVDLGALVIKEAIKRAGLRPAVSPFVKSCCPVEYQLPGRRFPVDIAMDLAHFLSLAWALFKNPAANEDLSGIQAV